MGNWYDAIGVCSRPKGPMPLPADLLVHIGVAFGLPVAESVYRALREEPRDPAFGEVVDWEEIRRRVIVINPQA